MTGAQRFCLRADIKPVNLLISLHAALQNSEVGGAYASVPRYVHAEEHRRVNLELNLRFLRASSFSIFLIPFIKTSLGLLTCLAPTRYPPAEAVSGGDVCLGFQFRHLE